MSAAPRAISPLDTTIPVIGISGDPVLLGALDSALRVRNTLLTNLKNELRAA